MPFEIVPAPHLPPHTCICCGCAKDEPHAFIPQTAPWEYNYPFLCRTCVEEMAGALGITKETVTTTVEVVREPTAEEILTVIGAKFTLSPVGAGTPFDGVDPQLLADVFTKMGFGPAPAPAIVKTVGGAPKKKGGATDGA